MLVLICSGIFFSITAQASHHAGSEITYTHLNGNMYKMRVVFYRDCFGIPAPFSVTVNIHSDSCGIDNNYTLNRISNTGIVISHPCVTTQTTCDGGNTPGYEKWEYETDVALTQCSDWTFTTSDCCRDGCTTVNPGSGMTVQAHLDNSVYDNSSPQFLNDPEFIDCAQQDFHYNHGATDPDGDSLAYHFIDAIGATYIFPYSGQYPIESVPPATFDSITGDFLMHATQAGSCGVITFEVMEFRNGVFIGSVIREIGQS